MKKIFTLCVSLLMGCVALNAQTFAFVDGETVIENGSTYNLSEAEIAAEGWGSAYQVPIFEGFNVKNVSNRTVPPHPRKFLQDVSEIK